MSDAELPCASPPVVIVTPGDGTLQLAGGTVLYHFVPLKGAIGEHHQPPFVPWREAWPEFMRGLVGRYRPLPAATSPVPYLNEQGPDGYPRLGEQVRPDQPARQATYNGWPLYTCVFDSPGQPVGIVAGLFEPVRVTLAPLEVRAGYSYPPTIGGP